MKQPIISLPTSGLDMFLYNVLEVQWWDVPSFLAALLFGVLLRPVLLQASSSRLLFPFFALDILSWHGYTMISY